MVSVIMEYGMNIPWMRWNQANYTLFKDIIKQVEVLDKDLGEPECVDPDKEKWMIAVELALKVNEQQAAKLKAYKILKEAGLPIPPDLDIDIPPDLK